MSNSYKTQQWDTLVIKAMLACLNKSDLHIRSIAANILCDFSHWDTFPFNTLLLESAFQFIDLTMPYLCLLLLLTLPSPPHHLQPLLLFQVLSIMAHIITFDNTLGFNLQSVSSGHHNCLLICSFLSHKIPS